MPQTSRYSDEHVEQIMAEIVSVLERHHAPLDLSFMVLGNMVTNLLNNSVSPTQRKMMMQTFTEALKASVREDQAH